MGHPIVTAYSCVKVREPSEQWFGVVRGVGRGIEVLDGFDVMQVEGKVWGVVPNFHYWISHWVAEGEISVKV